MNRITLAFQKDSRRVEGSWLLIGPFCLGPLWLVIQRMWMPALIYLLITMFSVGIAWLVLPFFTGALCRAWYESQGWTEVTASGAGTGSQLDEGGIILCGIGVMSMMMLGFIGFCWWVGQ